MTTRTTFKINAMPVRFLFAVLFLLYGVSVSGAADYTVTTTVSGVHGSIQAAIDSANASGVPRAFVIGFNLPAGSIIYPYDDLPSITRPVVIDGTTNPGYQGTPVITICGDTAAVIEYKDRAIQLYAGSDSSTIRGLFIKRFVYAIDCRVSNVLIEENVLSGNVEPIRLRSGAHDITVRANKIGTTADGTGAYFNYDGFWVENTTNVTIGGPSPSDGNVISGNTYKGIWVKSGNVNLLIQNNKIGTSADGTSALPNEDGIYFDHINTSGEVKVLNNLISGNSHNGIFINQNTGPITIKSNIIGMDETGMSALPNPIGIYTYSCGGSVTIGGTSPGERNIISGNTNQGIFLLDCNQAAVTGNRIGVRADDGIVANQIGLFCESSDSVEISSNLISGNGKFNIQMKYSNYCTIQANKIGTDSMGAKSVLKSIPASLDGINISTCNYTMIGGSSSSNGNVISGNHNGIFFMTTSEYTTIKNNKIGTDITGEKAIGNSNGIYFQNQYYGLIEDNIVSGNDAVGILLYDSFYDTLRNNNVGVTPTLKSLGNGEEGISLRDKSSMNYLISNVVGDNGLEGLVVNDSCESNRLWSNFIGTDSSGQLNLRNQSYGIRISDHSWYNKVGGIAAGQANKIAYNLGDGVYIDSNSAENLLSANLIFLNTGKGINLDLSGDYGNNGKAHPIFTSVIFRNDSLILSGTSTADKDTIQFFTSDDGGQDAFTFLSAYTAYTSGTTWTTGIPFTLVPGGYVTATATDINGNTSEFSGMVSITNCPTDTPTFTVSIPCPGKPIITGKPTLFEITNFQSGYTYVWNMEAGYDAVSTTADLYYSFTSGGIKLISVDQTIANCSVASAVDTLNVEDLEISADNTNLCDGQIATLSVIPNNLDSTDYVWYKDGVLLNNSGPSYEATQGGVYEIVISIWDCDTSSSSMMSTLSLSSNTTTTSDYASKQVLIVERVCHTSLGCGNCLSPFTPEPGKAYLLSAWVLEDVGNTFIENYTRAGVQIQFYENNGQGNLVTDTTDTLIFHGDGPIIDGWQRVEGTFTVPTQSSGLKIILLSSSEVDTYYDDIRIHPFDANLRTFVYDPETGRLMAALDENNYASFYEYDQDGKPIRVKKETERGTATIQENFTNTFKQ